MSAMRTLPRGPSTAQEIHDRRWWTLAVLVLSLIIIFVGNSSLNVAIPVLSRDLNATTSQLQWVVAVYSLVFAGVLVPRSKDPEEARVDPGGALLSIVGIVALVYGLIEAPGKGWGSASTLLAFAVATVVLAGFVVWEKRVDEPMLDMRYFRNPSFSTGSGGMILVFLGMYGVMFMLTQYLQLVLGYSALGAAIRFLPMTPVMLLVAPRTPRLSERFGPHRVVAAGMTLTAMGFVLFANLQPTTGYAYILVSIFPFAAGLVYRNLPHRMAGEPEVLQPEDGLALALVE